MSATHHRPLRVVVLYTSGHLGSAILFNEMARMPEIQIVGLVRTEAAPLDTPKGREKAWRRLWRLGKRFSSLLVWQRAIQTLGYAVGRLLPWRRRWRAGREVVADLDIPELTVTSVNTAKVRDWIGAREPDLLVSACFARILKPKTIDLPRLGVLNVHPGYLPAHRGAMAYFWPLHEDAAHAGASVHWIDAGIDTGPLLARRRLAIGPDTTQQQVLARAALTGARLLRRVLRPLARGRQPEPIAVDDEPARHFPVPERDDFDRYFARRRFFRIRDVLSLLWRRARRGRTARVS